MRLLLLSVLLLSFTLPQAQGLKVGAAKRDITPSQMLPISGGMGEPVIPTGKLGNLSARVMVIEKGGTRMAIACVDNLGWTAYWGDKSRELIKGIPPANVIIGATHSHSCPDAYGFPDKTGKTTASAEYLGWCARQIADAVNEAVSKLEPAEIKTMVDEIATGISYNYYATELYDRRCGVIQAISASGKNKGKAIATLVNYATHPEILGTGRKMMSPDLCGPFYDRIEAKGGGIAIFMNSAQGGMVTADNRRPGNQEANDWNECIRVGELLADEALRIIQPVAVTQNPAVSCAAKKISFPVQTPEMIYVLNHSPYVKNVTEKNGKYFVTTQVNKMQIGETRILTIPGEALPNVGFYLKRNMNTRQPFLFGLTNDAFGYMLAKVDYKSFKRYDYISRTCLGEMTAEIYMEEALKFLNAD